MGTTVNNPLEARDATKNGWLTQRTGKQQDVKPETECCLQPSNMLCYHTNKCEF